MMQSKLAFYDRAHEQVLAAIGVVRVLGLDEDVQKLYAVDDDILVERYNYMESLEKEMKEREK